MTKPARQNPATPSGRTVGSILGEDMILLGSSVDEAIRSGDAAPLLALASSIGGKVAAVSAVLADPCPATVSGYLRYVAAGVSSSGSRHFAASSLRLLQAALASAR